MSSAMSGHYGCVRDLNCLIGAADVANMANIANVANMKRFVVAGVRPRCRIRCPRCQAGAKARPVEVPYAAARQGRLHRRPIRARLQRKDFHLSVARHRCRRASRRSRQPLRHARLSRVFDGHGRRPGDRPRCRARYQERPVGGPADVGARRGREGRPLLLVLSREGQAGCLPHRRRGWKQPGGSLHCSR